MYLDRDNQPVGDAATEEFEARLMAAQDDEGEDPEVDEEEEDEEEDEEEGTRTVKVVMTITVPITYSLRDVEESFKSTALDDLGEGSIDEIETSEIARTT